MFFFDLFFFTFTFSPRGGVDFHSFLCGGVRLSFSLVFQNTASNKSLTEMPKDLVKDAVTVRKSLLGYMGDKQMSFPETLAQNILMKGLDKPKIRDEVSVRLSIRSALEGTAKGASFISE